MQFLLHLRRTNWFLQNQTSGISSLNYTIWQHFQTFMYHWRNHKHQEIYFCCCLLVSILTGNNNHCHNSVLLLIFAIILQTFLCLVVETGNCSRFIDPPSPTHLLLSFFNVVINSRMGGKRVGVVGGGGWHFFFFFTMRSGGSYDEERSWVGCGRVGGAGEERNMGMRQESTVAQF